MPSPLSLTFDSAAVSAEPFGYMVEARSLRVALNAALPGLPNLRVFAPATATVERRAEGDKRLHLIECTYRGDASPHQIFLSLRQGA